MMLGRFIQHQQAKPDGGIGTLTEAEEQRLNDLLNAEPPCECGVCACNNPIADPNRRPGV